VRLVVFSDLDGTLLDHDTYAYDAAEPALAALKARNVPLVLATSKTAAEVADLHAALALGDTPAIVENGAGLFTPNAPMDGANAAYAALRETLKTLPDHLRAPYRGFGDMSAEEVSDLTGLTLEAAVQARARCFSEPGLWGGDDATKQRFLDRLAQNDITGREGGRFLTLSHGRTKADAMAELTASLGATKTIALGDAPNDMEMLQAADIGVIVRNDHGPGIPPLPGETTGRILRTALPGPAGWSATLLDLLEDHNKGL